VLVLSIPLFVLAFIVGGTDGLVRRDLRRFGAGRESSVIYHRAKQMVVPLIIAPWVVYLAWPVSVHPSLILIPCAVALGLAVLVTAATFKKYLGGRVDEFPAHHLLPTRLLLGTGARISDVQEEGFTVRTGC
jgi:integrating conjugative element membrane protein (TIGR03747 family)